MKGLRRSLPKVYQAIALAEGVDPSGTEFSDGAINAALSAQQEVWLPPGLFRLNGPLNIPQDKVLRGSGELTVLRFENTLLTGVGAVQSAGPGACVKDLLVDGGNGLASKPQFATYCVLMTHADCKVDNVSVSNWRSRGIWLNGAINPLVQDCDFPNPGTAGPSIRGDGVVGGRILNNDTSGNPSNFGIYMNGGSNGCLIMGNYCNNAAQLALGTRSLEPIGITRSCYNMMVIGNHCEGSGDNGISLTCRDSTCIGNTVIGNYHNGIISYGEGNIVVGNRCHSNSKRYAVDATSFPNIHIQPAFGGRGLRVVVTNNVCTDEGGSPTAECPVKISSNAHTQWTNGGNFSSSNPYCFNGLNVYHAASLVGTVAAGANAPVHTSGTVSDGAIAWTFLYSAADDLHPRNCVVANNISSGHRLTDLVRTIPTNLTNEVVDSGVSVRGATSARPSLAATAIGQQFFDTSLGLPIWWSGTVWKDAAGNTV